MALCEKTRYPLILNMVSVDISMVKICLVNKFMVILSLHTGCPAKRVHFFILEHLLKGSEIPLQLHLISSVMLY